MVSSASNLSSRPFCFDCVEVLEPVNRRDIICPATRLRMPSRKPSHTTLTRRAYCLVGFCPDTDSTFTTGLPKPSQGAWLKDIWYPVNCQ
ncbi:hypothetical protein TNCV_4200791 [Trichonephila clavipes]|uniref:Uncharacterized protein n=1 Tax=Trichonephila clavipes TaxID=2585209 RepID=A0A8X7BHS4_TRICX|nr:hypothetical protein TNCV_4200791 [Trichonephila clavipes]